MHIKPYEVALMKYTYYRWHKYLRVSVPPVLIVLGVFGNIFAFVILRRKTMLHLSTYVYLMVLSVADMLVIITGLLRLWISEMTGYDVEAQAEWLCRSITALGYTVSDWSVWLILAVTVERYIVVCHPLKANAVCIPRRAFYTTLLLLALLAIVNLHFLWTVQVKHKNILGVTIATCEGAADYKRLVDKVWPWVDAAIYSLCPFVAVFSLNILIIHRVVVARKRTRDLCEDASRSNHQTSTRLTVMLLSINFSFLVTTFPMTLVNIRIAFFTDHANMDLVTWWKLAYTVTQLLMYANHCLNFYLYLATGQKFRSQIKLLCTRSNVPPNQQHSTVIDNEPDHPTGVGAKHGETIRLVEKHHENSTQHLPVSER